MGVFGAKMAKKSSRKAGRRRHGARCLCCGKRHEDGAPWWNKGKSGWSISWTITINKKKKSRSQLLVKARDINDREAHDLAMQKWEGRRKAAASDQAIQPSTDGENLTVRELVDLYLEYLLKNAKPKTFEDCRLLFKDLCDSENGIGDMTVGQLRAVGVTRIKEWAKSHAGWGKSTLGMVYARVKAVFNYAANSHDNEEALDLIASSPIRKLNTGKNRLKSKARVSFFTQKQEAMILSVASKSKRCPQFATAFKMLITTGCRPEEFCSVTAADVKTDEHGNLYWWVQHKNQKHTQERRRVYLLTAEAEEITRQMMDLYPTGPLFRNGWGRPWTKTNLLNRLRWITRSLECKLAGLDEYKVTNFDEIQDVARRNASKKDVDKLPVPEERREYKYVVYTTRHTFAYRWANGVYGRELTYQRIADLMGNSVKEVERTYAHTSKGAPDLVKALKKIAIDTADA